MMAGPVPVAGRSLRAGCAPARRHGRMPNHEGTERSGPMLLVVCGLDDESALWFARRAAQSGADCTIVTTEALSYARHFSHRLAGGEVRTTVRLADGTPLVDSEI